ncbi:MAG: CRISPR system precrRNA processing endoribonuclease RAMP protein Cas6 [Thermofilum sp.]
MPASITQVELVLRATGGGSLPWFCGSESRGAFLSVVSQADRELAERLHGAGRALFALKPIRFSSGYSLVGGRGRPPVEAGVVFEPGATGVLEVTLLDDEVARRFFSEVLPRAAGLSVKGLSFKVEGVSARVVDPASVLDQGDGGASAVDLRFLTLTYLNPLRGDQKYKILYPDPLHLLANLVASAHALTGRGFPKPEELAEHVYISGLDIRTPRVQASKPAPTGFVGWARLTFKKSASPEARKLVTGLLKLGELVNVGGNRTAGYGVVEAKLVRGSGGAEQGA